MGAEDFIRELGELGFNVERQGQYAIFPFAVPIGRLLGSQVKLALVATADFPLTPPPGPHVSPRLGHPRGGVHASDLGPEWEYWSRPIPHWNQSRRSVGDYMGHIKALFDQL